MRILDNLDELAGLTGQELGTSDWLEIDQDRVNGFADATGDHQWIHVDVERAASGPFGGTIAHGYLTLSLVPMLGSQVFSLETPGAKLNYGVNKVRFPHPVKVGSRIRAAAEIADVSDVPAGKQLVTRYTVGSKEKHRMTNGDHEISLEEIQATAELIDRTVQQLLDAQSGSIGSSQDLMTGAWQTPGASTTFHNK